jgi:hypothetical protein
MYTKLRREYEHLAALALAEGARARAGGFCALVDLLVLEGFAIEE